MSDNFELSSEKKPEVDKITQSDFCFIVYFSDSDFKI